MQDLMSDNSLGIIAGLVLGKPIGVTMFCLFAVLLGLTKLPSELQWKHIFGSGLLAGIGFTMSIFITNLAFSDQAEMINSSKFAILVASLCSGVLGYIWLMFAGSPALHTDKNS